MHPLLKKFWIRPWDSSCIIGYLFFHKIADDMCLTYECMPYHKQSVTFYLEAQKEINMLELGRYVV